ncbi:GDYXXLXY domain-containing protein [Bacillus sp. CGMCC 1.16607]|uniref:GDYXXLXY domain-containing protein n=1 Tax=Bacillus sp. CGMCC 1.16607 TaxID=3351842 RepID=UPI0036361E81
MNKHLKQLIIACTFPVLILLGMTLTPLITLVNGEEIILQTVPVDPSDLFRGDYVTLRYEAEEVRKELVEPEVVSELEKGANALKVYVLLEQKNGVYTPTKVSLNKPKNGIYLKGRLEYIGQNVDQIEVAYIQYSLDKYFVEDNTGLDWEKASAKGEILAKVKVNHGYAYLVDIIKK